MTAWFDPDRTLGNGLDVVGFGEVMVLLQPDPPQTLAESAIWRVHVAGAEFNACAAAASLGARAALCTRLGDDPPAAQVRRYAQERGVELRADADGSAPTGIFLKDALPDGERRVHYYRAGSAASRMDESDAARGMRDAPRVILLSGLTAALGDGPASLMIRAAEDARTAGAVVALDVNLRPRLGRLRESIDTVERLLEITGLLVVGTVDAAAVFGTTDPDAIGRAAREAGAREVVVTAGAEGCWWQDSDGTMRGLPSLATEVVDPVGAGDAFTGAYIAARLSGLAPKGAAWLGSALAARIIAMEGDTAGLPDPDEAVRLRGQAAEFEEADT
jgi:2-dehydro-3-deoxygluconokinase